MPLKISSSMKGDDVIMVYRAYQAITNHLNFVLALSFSVKKPAGVEENQAWAVVLSSASLEVERAWARARRPGPDFELAVNKPQA